MSDFICVYQTSNSFEANMIKSFLDAKGINCTLKQNDKGGSDILIDSNDLEKGKQILQQMKGS